MARKKNPATGGKRQPVSTNYTGDQIEHLSILEGIRRNLGMYFNTDAPIEYALRNHALIAIGMGAPRVDVTLHADRSMSVIDQRPGFEGGVSECIDEFLDVRACRCGCGRSRPQPAVRDRWDPAIITRFVMHVPVALTASCEWMDAEIEAANGDCRALVADRETQTVVERPTTGTSGLRLRYLPDYEMFEASRNADEWRLEPDFHSLNRWARDVSHICPGVSISVTDARTPHRQRRDVWFAPANGGLELRVRELHHLEEPLQVTRFSYFDTASDQHGPNDLVIVGACARHDYKSNHGDRIRMWVNGHRHPATDTNTSRTVADGIRAGLGAGTGSILAAVSIWALAQFQDWRLVELRSPRGEGLHAALECAVRRGKPVGPATTHG